MRKPIMPILIMICLICLMIYYIDTWHWHEQILRASQTIFTALQRDTDEINETYVGKDVKWEQLQCYIRKGNKFPTLLTREPILGQSIFFHETACHEDIGEVHLTPREACAVESAALHHPEKDVFLLFPTPISIDIQETKNVALKALLKYNNIHPRHIHFPSYLRNTKMDKLMPLLQESEWAISHASDILRYTTLYKYRGTYLDLDVIVTKPLPDKNFVGAESEFNLGAGVINFGDDKVGEDMAERCAEDLYSSFNGHDWGNNGPKVISRVLYEKCGTNSTMSLWNQTCEGFHIWPPEAFYAIPYTMHQLLFVPWGTKKTENAIKNSYIVHYWGKFTSEMSITSSAQVIHTLAQKHCPKVFEAVGGIL